MKKIALILLVTFKSSLAICQNYSPVLDTSMLHRPILLNRDGTYIGSAE